MIEHIKAASKRTIYKIVLTIAIGISLGCSSQPTYESNQRKDRQEAAILKPKFESAMAKGTTAAYEDFLLSVSTSGYTSKSSKKLAYNARVEIERIRFEEAIDNGNTQVLERLLRGQIQAPHNNYVTKAKEIVAKMAAIKLLNNESLAAYRSFFSRFGNTNETKIILNSFDDYFGSIALSESSVVEKKDLELYLKILPNGAHVRQVDELYFKQIVLSDNGSASREDIQSYLKILPNGAHVRQVDELYFKQIVLSDNGSASRERLRSYLIILPDGIHRVRAQEMLAEYTHPITSSIKIKVISTSSRPVVNKPKFPQGISDFFANQVVDSIYGSKKSLSQELEAIHTHEIMHKVMNDKLKQELPDNYGAWVVSNMTLYLKSEENVQGEIIRHSGYKSIKLTPRLFVTAELKRASNSELIWRREYSYKGKSSDGVEDNMAAILFSLEYRSLAYRATEDIINDLVKLRRE